MKLQAGTFVILKVARETEFGFFLTDGENDVLLHISELNGKKVKIDDEIKVFLYHDHVNRISATLDEPILTLGEEGWLEVKDINQKLGIFLDNGISKQILLPRSELPTESEYWPALNDQVFVKLGTDKTGRVLAELGSIDSLEKISTQADNQLLNKILTGYVYLITREGWLLFIPQEKLLGFIHRTQSFKNLRLGEKVTARVTYVREDGRINLTFKQAKEKARIEDADRILNYLKERGGSMPYDDATSPQIILEKFQLSKAAFKRAIGKLLKEGKIEQKEGWTYLK